MHATSGGLLYWGVKGKPAGLREACKFGIRYTNTDCLFAHPNRARRCCAEESVAVAPVTVPTIEYPAASATGSVKSSVEVPKVSAETTNFTHYHRLLMEVGKNVLTVVFKGSYKSEKNNPWTESCGQSLLNEKFPDGPSRRHLQKESVDNIRSCTNRDTLRTDQKSRRM